MKQYLLTKWIEAARWYSTPQVFTKGDQFEVFLLYIVVGGVLGYLIK